MWTTGGCLVVIFLGVTSLVTVLALRSAWSHRFEPPLTTMRLVLLVLLIIGAAVIAVATRIDWLLVPIVLGVFLISVGWLILRRVSSHHGG